MENFFHFFSLPEKFFVDEKALRQQYLNNSKAFHPDFVIDDAEQYNLALSKTSLNNRAYKNLKNFIGRVEHILELYSTTLVDSKKLPQTFLMEMMDVNEAVLDMKKDADPVLLSKTTQTVQTLENEYLSKLTELGKQVDEVGIASEKGQSLLINIQEIYLKNKYVLRLKESLNTFAPL